MMLVSADFLASKFCFEEEWPVAKKRWEDRKAIVTFAVIGPCQWKHEDIGQTARRASALRVCKACPPTHVVGYGEMKKNGAAR